jgi:hypothetical protein
MIRSARGPVVSPRTPSGSFLSPVPTRRRNVAKKRQFWARLWVY